jgi:EmrB/QacA subfamily drug resistance transporter
VPVSRRTHRPLTVLGVLLAIAMAALEATVVSTAMPTVVGDLGGIEHYAWVFTAYLVMSTVTVPIYGKLADLHGRKPVLLVGIAAFLAGSIACGAATSMPALVAFRALQGLGAGGIQPITMTLVGDLFELEERAFMQGVIGSVWGVSGLLGPVVGGLIVRAFSWRWVFLLNVPFGLAAGLLLFAFLHERPERTPHRFDVAGAALLAGGVLALLAGVRGGPGAAVELALSAALLVAFVAVERRAAEPLLPLELFRRRLIAVSSVAGSLVGAAMFCTLTFLPLFVQGVLGGSPTDAGAAITPMVVGWPIASTISGKIAPRVGFRPLARAGLAVTAASTVALALVARPGVGPWGPRLVTAAFGVGMGLANTALILAVQTSVEWGQRGVATASTMFFRTIGGALGLGALGALLGAALARRGDLPAGAASRLLGGERGAGLDPALAGHLADALATGLHAVFWAIAGLASAAFLASLLLPPDARRAAPSPAA